MSLPGGNRSYDVRIWAISTYEGKRGTTYSVVWIVAGRKHRRTFATRKLADSFRAGLLTATRSGIDFHQGDGLPATMRNHVQTSTWYEHACAFMDMKWAHASPRHRKSMAEALVTVTCTLVSSSRAAPPAEDLRAALFSWSFNTAARRGKPVTESTPPVEHQQAAQWIARHSIVLADLTQPVVTRRALMAISLKLDETAASPSTVARKRSALYSALEYAVELGRMPANPMDATKASRRAYTDTVDRRVVVNPDQAEALLGAVRAIYPALEAFFACIYYAALRPAEVRHMRERDCQLPEDGWGTLLLTGSTSQAGSAWTDSGDAAEDRQLKHRARRETRSVPAAPELVAALRRHIEQFPPGVDGRLFVTRTGRSGAPLAGPFAKPISMGIVYRVWQVARAAALTPDQFESPLARRPYDLRHAAVSLWLNAGVPATQVADWAGHSVAVLLRVYAKCVYGQEDEARLRIDAALRPEGRTRASSPDGWAAREKPGFPDPITPETSGRIRGEHP